MKEQQFLILGNTHNTTNKKVIEKRTPTDESIKLFDEFTTKAEKKVIERCLLEIPFIESEISFIRMYDHTGFDQNIVFKFRINGKNFTSKLDNVSCMKESEIIESIIREIGKIISIELVTGSYIKMKQDRII